jgi:peroxiredoxin Q/BCP
MRNRGLVALTAAAIIGAFVGPSIARGEEGAAGPEVGKAAPAFRVNDHAGKAVSVGGAAGTAWTVLAFYPKAMTPGCTKEVCSMRDALKDLEALEARVYAISTDDVVSCAQFVKEQSLNFPLLSDPDGSVVAKYGTAMENRPYALRHTFVIDPKGVLRHVDKAVNVTSHGADLVAVLKKLKGA